MSVYFNGKKVSIASTTKIYGGKYNVTAEDKEDGTQKIIINTTPTNPAIVPTGTIDITENERVDVTKYAFANVNVSSGTELPEYMSAKNFTFNGSTCTNWVGPSNITEVVVPKSYSFGPMTAISMNGAPINKDAVISTLTSFTKVVFCKSDGTNLHTYTSPTELSGSFLTDFPDDDVVLVSLLVNPFNGNLENKLNAILIAPFIAATSSTAEKIYYTKVEDFTGSFGLLPMSAYFSGEITHQSYIDGNDYNVDSINSRSGFNIDSLILLNNIKNINIYNSSIKNISIPSTAIDITLTSCDNLININIPEGAQTIQPIDGGDIISSCHNIEYVTLPSTLTNIYDRFIYNCTSIKSYNISSTNQNYLSEDGVLFNKDKTTLVAYPPKNTNTSYVIPDSVTAIYSFSFNWATNLRSITIPGGISDTNGVFYNCSNLQTVICTGQMFNIGSYTFSDCDSVKVYDFRNCTAVPTLEDVSSLGHATGCKIIIPDSLYDEWIIATNWSSLNVTYVKASEYVE